jgi:rhamnopyranosyl-N-acetylglucosaminyl-diphospho-decaprenol beta-1,3/1,4-galactofuranosyltransferase
MDIRKNSVGAVVVTYNRRHLLERVIDSLSAQSRPVDHIYIVDNASTDGTEEYLSTLQVAKKISIQRMPTNTGGSGGFSHGMKWAFDEGHEWIWLMDDDLLPAVDCLDKLLGNVVNAAKCRHETNSPDREQCEPSAVAILPLRLNSSGEVVEWSAQKINLANPFVRAFRSDLVCYLYRQPSSCPPAIPVIDFTFEGPLFHRKVPERVGFPRADFFIYCDETEYALRMQRFGFQSPVCVSTAHALRMDHNPFFCETVSWKHYYAWRNLLVVQHDYAENWVMALRPYAFFVGSTLKRLATRRLTLREAVMRSRALFDSIIRTFPRPYLP